MIFCTQCEECGNTILANDKPIGTVVRKSNFVRFYGKCKICGKEVAIIMDKKGGKKLKSCLKNGENYHGRKKINILNVGKKKIGANGGRLLSFVPIVCAVLKRSKNAR